MAEEPYIYTEVYKQNFKLPWRWRLRIWLHDWREAFRARRTGIPMKEFRAMKKELLRDFERIALFGEPDPESQEQEVADG